jgi:hypothetical protein
MMTPIKACVLAAFDLKALLGAVDDEAGAVGTVWEAEGGRVVERGSGLADRELRADGTGVGVAPVLESVVMGGVGSTPERVPGLKPLVADTLEGPVEGGLGVACDRLTKKLASIVIVLSNVSKAGLRHEHPAHAFFSRAVAAAASSAEQALATQRDAAD